jgi:hypothetical protein
VTNCGTAASSVSGDINIRSIAPVPGERIVSMHAMTGCTRTAIAGAASLVAALFLASRPLGAQTELDDTPPTVEISPDYGEFMSQSLQITIYVCDDNIGLQGGYIELNGLNVSGQFSGWPQSVALPRFGGHLPTPPFWGQEVFHGSSSTLV